MKITQIVYIFIFFCFSVLCSCKKNEEMDISMQGIYYTDFLEVTPAIDLNQDGIASINLLDEKSPYAQNSRFFLELKTNTNTRVYLFSQVFPSARIDHNNEVLLESNAILTSYTRKGNIITPLSEGRTENLISATIIDENTVEVHSYAEFVLPDGKQRVEMKGVYTRSR